MNIKLKQTMKSSIRKLLYSQGYSIERINPEQSRSTMEGAFRAIVKRQQSFNTVIDVGASNGSWSASLMRYYPLCQYLLIEAQPVHEKALIQFSSNHGNVQFALAAAGETLGHIYFDATDPFGGQASYTPYSSNNIQIPLTTIDNEVQSKKLPGPYLLKLDTHGFEVPILKGATSTLNEIEVIIMECYNFKIAPECLLFFEMIDYLKQFGFRCIDLVNTLCRPYDDSLWQMDLVFVKDNRSEFLHLTYS